MIVAGLTGSIAMGKSTVASMFAAMGHPVFDADAAVGKFYESDRAAAIIGSTFPGVAENGVVRREILASRVLADNSAMARLESIVHPEVDRQQRQFIVEALSRGRKLVLIDVPLLFETGGDRSFDIVLVVSASYDRQRKRALARANMNVSKLERILDRQIPDTEKRRRAHFIIDTNGSIAETAAQVAGLTRAISNLSNSGIRNARNCS
jgi:dephospho-CoA kinase